MLIGICGGSGSGKTTVARKLVESLGEGQTVVLTQDSYYRDYPTLSLEERAAINFDHPDSVDFELLIEQVRALQRHQPVECPEYDFSCHRRSRSTQKLEPRPLIIVEGILIFHDSGLRDLFDLKVFVDTGADLRFIRRMRRDVRDRGRTVESVVEQYLRTVRPMHLKYVEPGKELAEIVLLEGGKDPSGIDRVVQWIHSHSTS
ncbi:MAG: uridine kinase [Terriglobia bacterium]